MVRETPIAQCRNIGISAHIDAGKTTTTERILFYTGINHKIGEVHEGTATMDWMDQEQERGITITSAATTAFWTPTNNMRMLHRINIIDTPGHVDFTVEVERSMRVLDGVCLVYCGVGGVQPQSETVWRQSKKYKIPAICFINKLDRQGSDFFRVCKQLKDRLGANPIPLVIPFRPSADEFTGLIDLIEEKLVVWDEQSKGLKIEKREVPMNYVSLMKERRESLLEVLCEVDEELLAKYVNSQSITSIEIFNAIRKHTIAGSLHPVIGGSAFKNKGIQTLLDAIINYLPSPSEVPPAFGESLKSNKSVVIECNDDSEFVGLVFKIMSDPFVGQLVFVRVYAGRLKAGETILNASKNRKERVGRILQMHANQRKDIDEINAGDIAAIVGIKDVSTGDTFCSIKDPILLEKIVFPEPVISQSVEPNSKEDQDKLGNALNKLTKEDPSFRAQINKESGQTIIAGMGELHLEIMAERMRREYGVNINVGRPEVSYRETISEAASKIEGKFVRQSGGRGQYGHVVINMESNGNGGYLFIDKTKGGVIPKEFMPAIDKGIKDALNTGVIMGYKVIDVKVELTFGSYHDVDSSEHAFRMAAGIACRKALTVASPVLLEPIMLVKVEVPNEYLGSVVGDVLSRRGIILLTQEMFSNIKTVDAKIPLAEMFGYSTALRSLTQGRGTYTMEFKQYSRVKQEIITRLNQRFKTN